MNMCKLIAETVQPQASKLVALGALLLATLFFHSVALGQTSKATTQPTSKPTAQATVYRDWPFDAKEAARRQDETAKALALTKETTLNIGDKFKMKLVLIPAGQFMMGATKEQHGGLEYQGPQHEVTLTKPFYMGVYDVTVEQFAAFVADTGYQTGIEKSGKALCWNGKEPVSMEAVSWKNPVIPQTGDHPVHYVNYDDAKAFCAWLGKKTGTTVTLPTEAQWEYACRAGTSTKFNTGDTITTDQANYRGNDPKTGKAVGFRNNTTPVGSFTPNAFGLYDMHGNVGQWCDDWLSGYETDQPTTDPRGNESDRYRGVRGGGFTNSMDTISSADRVPGKRDSRCDRAGFRVICTDLPTTMLATQPGVSK